MRLRLLSLALYWTIFSYLVILYAEVSFRKKNTGISTISEPTTGHSTHKLELHQIYGIAFPIELAGCLQAQGAIGVQVNARSHCAGKCDSVHIVALE